MLKSRDDSAQNNLDNVETCSTLMLGHAKPYRTVRNCTGTRRILSVRAVTMTFSDRQTMSDHVRPCQTMLDHVRPCQTMSDHVRPCRTMSDHVRPCQTMSDHVRPCQTISGRIRISPPKPFNNPWEPTLKGRRVSDYTFHKYLKRH